MKLNIDVLALELIAQRFGSTKNLSVSLGGGAEWDPVDVDLRKGKEVALEQVFTENGLLSFEGRQVLLYIRDHGFGYSDAVLDPAGSGRKFHVAECETLAQMRSRNRFQRYVATNRMDGLFNIAGTDRDSGSEASTDVHLQVCINCLKRLNYGSVRIENRDFTRTVRDRFSLQEFFETYSTLFKHLPSGFAKETGSVGYTSDWAELSASLRKRSGYRCEECLVVLTSQQRLLQVHHKNGVKSDNRPENLQPLCMDCHRKEPDHGHIFIPAADMRLISKLRAEQGLVTQDWKSVLKRADLAVRPGLELAFKRGWAAPVLGATVKADSGQEHFVDASWREQKCVVTAGEGPRLRGWRVYTPIQLVDAFADR